MWQTFSGAAGEAFATEYKSFLDVYKDLPNVDKILMTGIGDVPRQPAVLFAVCMALASRINDVNAANVFTYLDKLPMEFSTACVKDSIARNPQVAYTRPYTLWATKQGNIVMN